MMLKSVNPASESPSVQVAQEGPETEGQQEDEGPLAKVMETRESGDPSVDRPGSQESHWGYTDLVIDT